MSERSGRRTPPAERSALCILPGAAKNSPQQTTAAYTAHAYTYRRPMLFVPANYRIFLSTQPHIAPPWYKLVLRGVADLLDYILNEDTHPATRAIGASHTA